MTLQQHHIYNYFILLSYVTFAYTDVTFRKNPQMKFGVNFHYMLATQKSSTGI